MTPIDLRIGADATAVACGAILSSLIDMLVENGTLTKGEVRTVLTKAMTDLGPRMRSEDGLGASRIVRELLVKFPQSDI